MVSDFCPGTPIVCVFDFNMSATDKEFCLIEC